MKEKKAFAIKIPAFQKRTWRRIIVIGVCLLLWCVLQIVRVKSVNALSDMQGAKRFAPEGGYTQIGCYFAESLTVEPSRYRELHYRIETALTKNAIESESDRENARLFLDCYHIEGSASLTVGKKSVTATAIGTGGDFFFLHQPELLSGMYYGDDALSPDRVLIDETVAWQLFGGNDVAGMTVEIAGVPHVISGVIKTGEGRMRKAAGAGGALVYMSATSLAKNGNLRTAEPRMEAYELVMPDPVREFAAKLVRETLGYTESEMELTDVSRRFGNFALLDVLRRFGLRSMAGSAMRYPFWENLARGTEDILVCVMVLQAVCLVVPVVLAVIMIVQAYRHKRWTAAGVFQTIGDKLYAWRAERHAKKSQKGRTVS